MATRREMLQALVASVGAGAAAPALEAEHHLARHTDAALEQAAAKSKTTPYTPVFLDRHQFETLQLLAERILPGARRARTSEFIDQLLAVDSPDDQRQFLTSLGAFEGRALARGTPWKQLGESDQVAILTEASTMASGRPAPRAWSSGDPVAMAPPARPVGLTLRDHFDLLKGWLAGAYYSSEIGMRELGWTGVIAHPAFPGCEHPDGHAG